MNKLQDEGVVYFIQVENEGPVKIGWTRNLLNRFQTIQTCNHEVLTLLAALRGNRKLEREMQAKFRAYLIRGEWYRPSSDLRSFLSEQPDGIAASFNEAWEGDCADCESPKTEILVEGFSFTPLCRACLMTRDGRMGNLIKLGKRVRPPRQERPCSHCGRQVLVTRKGLCGACNEYKRRTGSDRPLGPKVCSNCGTESKRLSRGRCPTCYQFWRRNGVDRVREIRHR